MSIELSPEQRLKVMKENAWAGDSARTLGKSWQVFDEGHGVYLRDNEGKEYIDAHSGQYCTVLGHGNKEVIKAVQEQLEKIQYPEALRCDAALRACQRIAELTPGDLNRVFLGLSGSDANEAAVSLARSYFKSQGKDNSMVIALYHAYHGMSSGVVGGLTHVGKRLHGRDLAASNHGVYHMFAPYCYRCAYGLEYPSCGIRCAQALDEIVRSMGPKNVAAFIGEPVIASGGSINPPDEYWPMIRESCDKHGILLILDEVITGWGKTGKLFGCDHWDVVPDIMTCAKGISTAYLPVSAVIAREHVHATLKGEWPYFGHTHSFYPAGAACAVATIDVIMRERLVENAATIGAHMKNRLEQICQESDIVGAVHGIGLLLGMEMVEDKATKVPYPRAANTIKRSAADRGVLLDLGGASGSIVSICPPMIITRDEADQVCDVLAEVIGQVGKRARKKVAAVSAR